MNTRWLIALGLVAGLSSAIPTRGQDQAIVVEGGTLIDGNGGAPLKNAVVVIEGKRIKAVGVKGKVSIPPNAKVIKADGKTILPGLIDTQVSPIGWPYQPPLYLYFGITTVYVDGNPYMQKEKQLQEKGMLKGPRMYIGAGGIQGPIELLRPDVQEVAKPWPQGWSVRTPAEAVAAVDKRIAQGGDAERITVAEGITPELLRAVADEAHKHGYVVEGHSEFDDMTSVNGQDIAAHMAGVIRSTITKPENVAKLKEMKEKNWWLYYPSPLGNYAYMMELATYDSLIDKKVKNHQFLAPTIAHTWWTWGTQISHSKEYEAATIDFAKNTPGLDYVPQSIRNLWLYANKTTARVTGRWPTGDQYDATHPLDMEGYAKIDEFLRRFVKAGGKLAGGGDNSLDNVPGLVTHLELEQLVYSGLTPMQAILSVTKWAAEAHHHEDILGTIEPGKLADLITVNGDPLKDIKTTRNVDLVVMDGKVIDRALDPNWKNPIQDPPCMSYADTRGCEHLLYVIPSLSELQGAK